MQALKGIASFVLACLLGGAVLYLVFVGGAVIAVAALAIIIVGSLIAAIYTFLQYLADRID